MVKLRVEVAVDAVGIVSRVLAADARKQTLAADADDRADDAGFQGQNGGRRQHGRCRRSC